MQPEIEKVTLSLNRELLEKMAKKAKKSKSEFIRDLIQREVRLMKKEVVISPEVQKLRGCLHKDVENTKARVHGTARRKIRDYDLESKHHKSRGFWQVNVW